MSHTWRFEAIGVPWEIATAEPLSEVLQSHIAAEIERFDADWSRFREDSVVAQLAGGQLTSAELLDARTMLELYVRLSDFTAAAVHPLVGDALSSLGYDRHYSLQPTEHSAPVADWRSMLSWAGSHVSLAEPLTIDVGALGKGRLVDRVLALVPEEAGNCVVDASGDLAVRGSEVVRVGLEHPLHDNRVIGVASVRDAAVAASASNRRAWGDGLHHVIDGRTGQPTRVIMATWVIAPEAMVADALATALFFDGGTELAATFDGVEWVRMLSTGAVQHSPLDRLELFTRP